MPWLLSGSLEDKSEVLEEQYLIEERLNTIEEWNLYKLYRRREESQECVRR